MTGPNSLPPTQAASAAQQVAILLFLKKLLIWCLFLLVIYLARDFFFMAFMTFMFSYLTLATVGWGMRRLSPGRERPWLRRGLTVAFFVLVPLVLAGVGSLLAPPLLAQGEHLAGWLSHVDPETEVARLTERFIGPFEFEREYGLPGDARYQLAFAEFQKTGPSHVQEYNDFPTLETWLESSFDQQFSERERARIRSRLFAQGTSSAAFEDWFRTQKFPQLVDQARKSAADKGGAVTTPPALLKLASAGDAQQALDQARQNTPAIVQLRLEWAQDAIDRELARARASPAYQQQFKDFYDKRRQDKPASIPYTYEQYAELKKLWPKGMHAFGAYLDKKEPDAKPKDEAQARADFEAAQKHELFQKWWDTSTVAKFLRHNVETRLAATNSDGAAWMTGVVASFINVPIELATALLLSFFICIDFEHLRRAARRLRDTWLRDVYDEIVPALARLAHLVGQSLRAQGLIALCNASLMFIALTLLGVEHEVLLSLTMFVLCLVPTIGVVLSWVLIVTVALVQPGGGFLLALKASGAVLGVLFLENFFLSPRILGKMMDLHPVLIIALLPVAQYFFGVWGLILATPVAVYVIYDVIFRQGLPGIDQAPLSPPNTSAQVSVTPNKSLEPSQKELSV